MGTFKDTKALLRSGRYQKLLFKLQSRRTWGREVGRGLGWLGDGHWGGHLTGWALGVMLYVGKLNTNKKKLKKRTWGTIDKLEIPYLWKMDSSFPGSEAFIKIMEYAELYSYVGQCWCSELRSEWRLLALCTTHSQSVVYWWLAFTIGWIVLGRLTPELPPRPIGQECQRMMCIYMCTCT